MEAAKLFYPRGWLDGVGFFESFEKEHDACVAEYGQDYCPEVPAQESDPALPAQHQHFGRGGETLMVLVMGVVVGMLFALLGMRRRR